MANQQNRQQPFRFWFPGWTNPAPRRPSATQGRSQTRTPATPSQPEAPLSQPPKEPQQKPTPPSPSTAQAPTNSPQPPPRTSSSSPSSPPSPSESKRPPGQPTLPSQVASQTESKSQSVLSSQVASQLPSPPSPSKPEPKRQSTLPSQVASQPSTPSPSEPDQKSQAPSPSRAAQPQPLGNTVSPPSPQSQGEPEPKRQPTLPLQVVSQPSSPSTNESDQKPQPPPPSSEPDQNPQPPSPSSEPEQNPQPPSPSSEPKPLPQEPQTALDASSPTVPAPETQLQTTSIAQESVPELTTQPTESTHPTESGKHISQKLRPNQIPTDSPMRDVSAETTLKNPNPPLQVSQPQEIKEKPTINPEQTQENKPDPPPKLVQTLIGSSTEERTNSEVEVNREKISSVPEDNLTVRKAEEKQEMSTTETPKPQTPKPQSASEETKDKHERRADLKQNINPEKASETGPISELIKKYNHLTKPEAHLNKPRDRASEESETKIEPRIAIQVADSRPSTRDITPEIKMSKPERIMQGSANVKEKTPENGNGASSRESRIAVSTIPKRVFADGEQANFQKEIKEGLSKLVQKLSTGQHPGGDQGVTIITLAGENKGATMIVDFDEDSMRSNRGFKLADKVGATRDNHMDQIDRTDNANPGITTSVNSNVQNINNSLLQDSSCSEGDPGVHLIISSKPKVPVYLIRKKEMLQSQKTDSSTLQPQKYTFETNVRRRCLRGLLLESSESDPDNPKKPRRHGCRVSCDDKKKGKAEDDGASASIGNRRNNKGKHEEMF